MPWFVHALRQAPCARNSLTTISAVVLGTALGEDAFPALESLRLIRNAGMRDEGCAALGESLRAANRMKLSKLVLKGVGMNDEGMKALARVV